jgi:hypothetical protein
MSDDEFMIINRSEADVESFKYDNKRKKQLLEKCKLPYHMPVVVYVTNPDIPDINKRFYIVHCFSSIENLLESIKNNQEDNDKNYEYGLKTEFVYPNEFEDYFLMEDLLIQEIWEDYKNPGDKFLYLIFDKK